MIMDFHQLLKQAKVKQKTVEKKHVEQKTKKEVEKRQKEVLEIQKQREASEKVKQLKEAAIKKQLEYKGLHKPSKALPTPHSSKSSHSSAKSSSKSKSSSTVSNGTSKSKPSDSKKTKDSSVSKVMSKSKTVSEPKGKPTKPTVAAVNFNDLMKMAKSNKEGEKAPIMSAHPPRRSSSPLGKSLLDKIGGRSTKSKSPAHQTRPTALPTKSLAAKGEAGQTSYRRVPMSPIKTVTVDVVRHPCSPTGSKGCHKPNGQVIKSDRSHSTPNKATKSVTKTTLPPNTRRPEVRTKLNPDLAARKAALQRRKLKASQPTAFYGSAAANILRRGREGGTGSAPFRYTSSWVDEMREELEDFEDYEDFSGDDDLDGFVVDEDDFIDDGEDNGDYSAQIRKIFGYDRRRFDDEKFDDRIMESSFAQQQFEEERSARIGKLEDDEDLRREQAEQLQKRKRKTNPVRTYGAPKSRLKQPKLSFT